MGIVYGIFIGSYALLILLLIIGFILAISKKNKPQTKKKPISIIVPFHNELSNLPQLIESLNKLDYPTDKFEVFLVNDCSNDDSEGWLEANDHVFKFKHFIINLTKKVGKKTAIEKAMIMVNFEKIVTTDADCFHHPLWLEEINNTKGKLAIGITLKNSSSYGILEKFQECESMILGGVTIGTAQLKMPILASGANLSFSKKSFEQIKPFEDNKHIASGDDMFFLEAILKQGKSIHSRSKYPVLTSVKKSWSSYLDQTTRWSAKTSGLAVPGLGVIALLTIIGNLFWIASIITWLVTKENIFLTLAIIKFTVDFLFLFLTSLRYNRLILIAYAPVMALIYPFYLIVLIMKVLGYKEKWSNND